MDTDKAMGKFYRLQKFVHKAEAEMNKIALSLLDRHDDTFRSTWSIDGELHEGTWVDVIGVWLAGWDPDVREQAWTGDPLVEKPVVKEVKIKNV